MRVSTTFRFCSLLMLLTALAAFLGVPAGAQVNPLWDHYKVYEANPKPPGPTFTVTLRDQFKISTHQVLYLDKFANPVEKYRVDDGEISPINDPILHYSWWRITEDPFDALVSVFNQFGSQTIQVYRSAYLLNPALKNLPTGQIPFKNHYKCYDCQGQPINRQVRLSDQFGVWSANVLFPVFFCNPVEKQEPGAIYPIEDPDQHYLCYVIDPPDPHPYGAFIRDQFIQTDLQLYPSRLLCVPTDKMNVTSAQGSTWGRIKQIYR